MATARITQPACQPASQPADQSGFNEIILPTFVNDSPQAFLGIAVNRRSTSLHAYNPRDIERSCSIAAHRYREGASQSSFCVITLLFMMESKTIFTHCTSETERKIEFFTFIQVDIFIKIDNL